MKNLFYKKVKKVIIKYKVYKNIGGFAAWPILLLIPYRLTNVDVSDLSFTLNCYANYQILP